MGDALSKSKGGLLGVDHSKVDTQERFKWPRDFRWHMGPDLDLSERGLRQIILGIGLGKNDPDLIAAARSRPLEEIITHVGGNHYLGRDTLLFLCPKDFSQAFFGIFPNGGEVYQSVAQFKNNEHLDYVGWVMGKTAYETGDAKAVEKVSNALTQESVNQAVSRYKDYKNFWYISYCFAGLAYDTKDPQEVKKMADALNQDEVFAAMQAYGPFFGAFHIVDAIADLAYHTRDGAKLKGIAGALLQQDVLDVASCYSRISNEQSGNALSALGGRIRTGDPLAVVDGAQGLMDRLQKSICLVLHS
ncbi:TPA: hypothetical protein HA281_02265 [Candidatus Woesearchaeota archaeon]|nr:hypothetical protein [Candidatus Woesearchaeota archaeon]HIH91603.1 hypothetical protein [Candidatus Woesearchaeota archaeon]